MSQGSPPISAPCIHVPAGIRSPGYRSDLAIFGALGELSEVAEGWRCALPALAAYPWANLLLLRDPPRAADVPALLQRFDALFPAPEVTHVSVGWDRSSAVSAEVAPFLERGLKSVDCVVMQRLADAPWVPTRPPVDGLRVRVVDLAEVREGLLACQLALDAEEPVQWGADLLDRHLQLHERLLARPGAGRWVVAELEGVLIASLGVLSVDGWGRLQAVGTHPHHRGRGIGEALLRVAWGELVPTLGVRGLQLITWRGGRAQTFYERLGFTVAAPHVGALCRREALR